MKRALQTPAKIQAQTVIAPSLASLVQKNRVCGEFAGLDGKFNDCRSSQLAGTRPTLVQAKLEIGPSNDKYEQEAEVMSVRLVKVTVVSRYRWPREVFALMQVQRHRLFTCNTTSNCKCEKQST